MSHKRDELYPANVTARALAVPIVAIVFTLILPGFIAVRGGVFFYATMLPKLPSAQRNLLAEFERSQAQRSTAITLIDTEIAQQTRNPATLSLLLESRNRMQRQIDVAVPPIAVIPFYLNPQMLLWAAVYTCLGWMALLVAPPGVLRLRRLVFSWKTLQLAVLTYVFYEWPLWARNALGGEGRVVYAFPNWDLDRGSFAMQEVIVAGFCFLLSVVWRQWFEYLKVVWRRDLSFHGGHDHGAVLLDHRTASSFAETFSRWAVASIVVTFGFIWLTALYWHLVGHLHDQRYLLSAILAHILWGITWIVISLPFINEWQFWNRTRTHALQTAASMQNTKEAGERVALLKEVQPVGALTLTLANVISFISFVLPILRAFLGN
jgi:hypothetical protein